MEEERAIFIRSYTNVPENLRGDIIVIIKEEPYSWNTSYFQIKNKTDLGSEILKKLKETGIIE